MSKGYPTLKKLNKPLRQRKGKYNWDLLLMTRKDLRLYLSNWNNCGKLI